MTTTGKKHKVVLVFSGTMVVGPPLPEETVPGRFEAHGPMFAVMPHGKHRPIDFQVGEMLERVSSRVHLPTIFTRAEHNRRPPDDRHHGFGIWYPLGERMEICLDGVKTPGPLRYIHDPAWDDDGAPGNPGSARKDPIEDFAAIPDMREVSPHRSKLKYGLLDRKAAGVAAQVFVPTGTLRSGAEDARKLGIPVQYHPHLPTKKKNPHLAIVVPQVRVTVEVEKSLTIETASLETGEPLTPISFLITGNCEIWIGNLEPEDVRNIIYRLETKKDYKRSVPKCDIDFARCYDLTEGQGDVVLPCDEPPEAGSRKCYLVAVEPYKYTYP